MYGIVLAIKGRLYHGIAHNINRTLLVHYAVAPTKPLSTIGILSYGYLSLTHIHRLMESAVKTACRPLSIVVEITIFTAYGTTIDSYGAVFLKDSRNGRIRINMDISDAIRLPIAPTYEIVPIICISPYIVTVSITWNITNEITISPIINIYPSSLTCCNLCMIGLSIDFGGNCGIAFNRYCSAILRNAIAPT